MYRSIWNTFESELYYVEDLYFLSQHFEEIEEQLLRLSKTNALKLTLNINKTLSIRIITIVKTTTNLGSVIIEEWK